MPAVPAEDIVSTNSLGRAGRGGRVRGSGFRVQGSGFRVRGSGFGVRGSGPGVRGSGFRVRGSGFGVRGSGFGVRGSGFGVQGSGFHPARPHLVPKLELGNPEGPNPADWSRSIRGPVLPTVGRWELSLEPCRQRQRRRSVGFLPFLPSPPETALRETAPNRYTACPTTEGPPCSPTTSSCWSCSLAQASWSMERHGLATRLDRLGCRQFDQLSFGSAALRLPFFSAQEPWNRFLPWRSCSRARRWQSGSPSASLPRRSIG